MALLILPGLMISKLDRASTKPRQWKRGYDLLGGFITCHGSVISCENLQIFEDPGHFWLLLYLCH
jgi:hypothetical protein